MTTATATTTQVYRVWIRASREKIWQAIVDPEWNRRYGYAAPGFYELQPGGSYRSTPNEGMIRYAEENGFEMPGTGIPQFRRRAAAVARAGRSCTSSTPYRSG